MITVKKTNSFKKGELEELTSATMDAIKEGIGFGWVKASPLNIKLEIIGKEFY